MPTPDRGAPVHDRLHVERVIAAPIEDVWEAWTTAEGLRRWWWAGRQDTTYEVDLSVGGTYSIAAPSAGIAVSGSYLAIDPPNTFEATWVWTDDDGDGPAERIAVSLEPTDGGTVVRVVHTGPWTTEQPADQYRLGWNHVLDELDVAHPSA